jgi:protein SCO1/2
MAADAMNESAPPKPFVLALLALALAIAGCVPSSPEAPPLQGASMGGPFTLQGSNGRTVSDRDFAGKYRIVYFGFSFCPDVCPTDLQIVGAGLRQFEESDPARAARVQPIFISVDPRRDTPDVLRQYVAAFHPRLIGLTGSEADIARVARAYGVYYSAAPPARPGGDYLVNHSRMIVLYGPQGEPVAILPHDQGPAKLAEELERWVR